MRCTNRLQAFLNQKIGTTHSTSPSDAHVRVLHRQDQGRCTHAVLTRLHWVGQADEVDPKRFFSTEVGDESVESKLSKL